MENDGTTISAENRSWSKQKRCLKLSAYSRPTRVRFFVTFASEEPEAQAQDIGGGGSYLPRSDDFPIERLGPNHSRWEFPTSWTFRTTNPNGTYGGTYPLSHWWFGLWHDNFLNGIYSETRVTTPGKRGLKVSFRKNGNLYVFRCLEAEPYREVYDPPWPEETPDDQGTPVPGKIIQTFGVK